MCTLPHPTPPHPTPQFSARGVEPPTKFSKKGGAWQDQLRIKLHVKDGMGLRMKNFNIVGVHWKIRLLGGGGWGFHEKLICRGNCLKREAWLKRGERGWYPNAHYAVAIHILINILSKGDYVMKFGRLR